jgi:hypothetical protein
MAEKRGKKNVKVVKLGEPVFKYFCTCHNEVSRNNKSEGSLGTWLCPRSNKKCKVTRTRNIQEVAQ